MRFATRIFIGSFVPFALLLAGSFWVVRSAVSAAVRDSLRTSTRENQLALAQERSRADERTVTLLRGVVENPILKAGLQLLAAERRAPEQARNTVRDQLSELGDALHYDLMAVSDAQGAPLAAVVRESGGFTPLRLPGGPPLTEGFYRLGDHLYELLSLPIQNDTEVQATLTVGRRFDIARFGSPAVLLKNGIVVSMENRDLAPAQVEAALRNCAPTAECEVRIQNQTYLSVPLKLGTGNNENGYSLRTLQNADAAAAPVQAVLERLFAIAGGLVLVAAVGVSAFSSLTVAQPLAEVAARLRESSAVGELPEFPKSKGGAQEIRDLTQGFNQAAKAVREGRERLTLAYVEFVGSLAQALDARDSYTAGHSRRVSMYSCAIAKALQLPEEEIEIIRVGALLHDLGKIGISDLVLQKPGKLTPEEEGIIRQHPVIGRRILDQVHGMEPYLPIVELHHENWDGTGYPHGLTWDQTPLHARIVKVADAYDAMTSDRPYRRGMSHDRALSILREVTGSQTDSTIVEAFASLHEIVPNTAIHALASAVESERAIESIPEPRT